MIGYCLISLTWATQPVPQPVYPIAPPPREKRQAKVEFPPTAEELAWRYCQKLLPAVRDNLTQTQEIIKTLESNKVLSEADNERFRRYKDEETKLRRKIADLEAGQLPTPEVTSGPGKP
jgi:hypothetical protein